MSILEADEVTKLIRKLVKSNSAASLHNYSEVFTSGQVAKFFERQNIDYTRHKLNKLLRKGMLPKQNSQRDFTREHLVVLAAYDFFSQAYSMEEVWRIFEPLFDGVSPEAYKNLKLPEIYTKFFELYQEQAANQIKMFAESLEKLQSTVETIGFEDVEEADSYKGEVLDLMTILLLMSQSVINNQLISLLKGNQ